MQIDWFTFGAQVVNFLILVGLLKHFLYGPITAAMDAREQRIADRLREAKEKRETAEEEAEAYRQKQAELESARERRLVEAEEEARERRQAMIEEARAEVDRLQAQWAEALRREREMFLQDLAQRVSRETMTLARRTLQELANADLEQQVVRVFVERIEALDDERRSALAEVVGATGDPVEVHTAFELGEEQRQRLSEALAIASDADVEPVFEVDADVGFGIEVRAGEHKIAWSLGSYFAELEEHIRDRIESEITAGAPAESGPAESEPAEAAVPDASASSEA